MTEFTIPIDYCTSVTTRKEWNIYTKNGREPTADELLLIVQGQGNCSMTGSDDHPEFAKLRNQLEDDGYIQTDRTSWNGDHVLKPFKLNGAQFNVNEQFPCAAAIAYQIERKIIGSTNDETVD